MGNGQWEVGNTLTKEKKYSPPSGRGWGWVEKIEMERIYQATKCNEQKVF
jgi:hypothetical protein